MSYADMTLRDPSRIKRFMQERRYADALKLFPDRPAAAALTIVDFGAGNGELSMRLAGRHPDATIICYEPGSLLEEAQGMVGGISNVTVIDRSHGIRSGSADVAYCLEVFEHLPDRERRDALDELYRILRSGGALIVGVPIEIGLPALAKGLFRMARRRGEFDATPENVLRSMLGLPYRARPTIEITAGLHYHLHHAGFDHRRLRREISTRFELKRERSSPFAMLGPLFNSEIYLVASRP